MGKYKNPVPSINDKRVSAKFSIVFKFEETMILDEAAEGLTCFFVKTEENRRNGLGWESRYSSDMTINPETLKATDINSGFS